MRRLDAIHSSPRPHNTLATAARARPRGRMRLQLPLSDRLAGHTQVRNIFLVFEADAHSCNRWPVTSVLHLLAELMETDDAALHHCMLEVFKHVCSPRNGTATLLTTPGLRRRASASISTNLSWNMSRTPRVALRLVVGGRVQQSSRAMRYRHDTSNANALAHAQRQLTVDRWLQMRLHVSR
jgi:hypothetical protein